MPITMSVKVSGSFIEYARERRHVAEAAVQAAVTIATDGLKTEMRQQIARAFPTSSRAFNMIGSKVYPEQGASFGAAGNVFARGKPGGSAERILTAFSDGVTISARNTKWLAIPTDSVPVAREGAGGVAPGTGVRGRGRRMTPVEVKAHFNRDLVFVHGVRRTHALLILPGRQRGQKGRRKGHRAESTARRTESDVVMFVLARRARLPKKLDPYSLQVKWGERIPEFIDRVLPKD